MLLKDCEDVVKDAWNAYGNDVHGLAMIKEKIEACGEMLRAWGSSKKTRILRRLSNFRSN